MEQAKEEGKKFSQKITKFEFKYPSLRNQIDKKLVFNHIKGHGNGHPEEILFDIFEYLEEYSKWRKELNELYDHQRVESIQYRIRVLQIYLKVLQTDTESTLIQLANIEMTPDILRELDSLNALGTFKDKMVIKPVLQWKTIQKAAILNSIFPEENAYQLAKKYSEILEVKNGSFKSAILRAKDPNNPISKLEIDEEQAKTALLDFLRNQK